MLLSIIIPCYNMELYLEDCIESLLKQGMKTSSYEVIIVNDESKDRTLEIANRYSKEHSQIKVIDKKNGGVGAARNTGFDLAKGEYIYFLDPDDFLAECTLPNLLEIAKNKQLDILTFDTKSVVTKKYPTSETKNVDFKDISVYDGITYIAKRKHQNEVWWFLINREFMLETGIRFIEGRWMEDAILTSELFCVANKIAHIDYDVHRYRILPTSAMRNKSPEHYNKVIYDNANAAHVFDDLIKRIPTNHTYSKDCINRLKTRQQSFVFFLMVRLMKSDIPISKIPQMLIGFEKIGAYPLNNFLGPDYHGRAFSFLVYIFNHKKLISPFIKVFRTFYKLTK